MDGHRYVKLKHLNYNEAMQSVYLIKIYYPTHISVCVKNGWVMQISVQTVTHKGKQISRG